MNKIGVSLVDVASGRELQTWDSLPSAINHGGEDRTGATIGAEFKGGALLVERFCEPVPFSDPAVVSEEAKFDGKRIVVTRVYADPDLAPIKARIVSGIKAEAGAIILAYCPQYKQANLTARAAEVALTYPGIAGDDLPEPMRSEWHNCLAIWEHIKAIREHSNALEAEVSKLSSTDELKDWRSHDWPKP